MASDKYLSKKIFSDHIFVPNNVTGTEPCHLVIKTLGFESGRTGDKSQFADCMILSKLLDLSNFKLLK